MTRVLYPLSADPITNGHIDLIERAANVYTSVIVGIGKNPDKEYLFTLEERLESTRRAVDHLSNVEVVAYGGLLVDYAWEQNINLIIRGMRNDGDFQDEVDLFNVSSSQELGIEFAPMFGSKNKLHISSRAIKALIKEQGLIHEYVPLFVKQSLEEKILGQYTVSVTGEIAMGKSYVCERLVEIGRQYGIPVYNIDMDKIGHQITSTLSEPRYKLIREEIVEYFGKEIANRDGTIDRRELGRIVFNNRQALDRLDQILYQPLLVRLRREMYGKKGILLLNGALIVEAGITAFSNNNTLLVKADKKTQIYRLKERGFTNEQIRNRANSQYTTKLKREKILEAIDTAKWGRLWELQNDGYSDPEIQEAFLKIKEHFGL